ncbi:MAG: hypothetical protein ACREOP_15230, partial [Thermodesulfobacteriota bacterium]
MSIGRVIGGRKINSEYDYPELAKIHELSRFFGAEGIRFTDARGPRERCGIHDGRDRRRGQGVRALLGGDREER